jgi:hypothetical protein
VILPPVLEVVLPPAQQSVMDGAHDTAFSCVGPEGSFSLDHVLAALDVARMKAFVDELPTTQQSFALGHDTDEKPAAPRFGNLLAAQDLPRFFEISMAAE